VSALVLRNGRPAARKVYKLIPDIPVLRQSSKPRVGHLVTAAKTMPAPRRAGDYVDKILRGANEVNHLHVDDLE
jgi:hypothetical protein